MGAAAWLLVGSGIMTISTTLLYFSSRRRSFDLRRATIFLHYPVYAAFFTVLCFVMLVLTLPLLWFLAVSPASVSLFPDLPILTLFYAALISIYIKFYLTLRGV